MSAKLSLDALGEAAQLFLGAKPGERSEMLHHLSVFFCPICGHEVDECICQPILMHPDAGAAMHAERALVHAPALTIVRPRVSACEWEWRKQHGHELPFDVGSTLLYLGCCGSGNDHCAVATMDGRVAWALHHSEFEIVPGHEIPDWAPKAARLFAVAWGRPRLHPRLRMLRLFGGQAPEWPVERKRDEHLLYLGEPIGGRPGEFYAVGSSGEFQCRQDLLRFEVVPEEEL